MMRSDLKQGIEIGARRELFLDDSLVYKRTGPRIVLPIRRRLLAPCSGKRLTVGVLKT